MIGYTYIIFHLLNNLHMGLVDAAIIIQTLLIPKETSGKYCLGEKSVLYYLHQQQHQLGLKQCDIWFLAS